MRRFPVKDVSSLFKHVSSFPLLASLRASLLGGTKTQGKDASEGNRDAIKRLGCVAGEKGS